MGKLRHLIVFFAILLVLSGCDMLGITDNEVDDTPIIDDNDDDDNDANDGFVDTPIWITEGMPAGFRYYTLTESPGTYQAPHQYFSATFTDVTFNPVRNELCFVININDSDFKSSEYWVITRDFGSTRTDSQYSFLINRADYQGRDCIGVGSGVRELVIGKEDSEDLNATTTIPVMASIVFEDNYHSSRQRIDTVYFQPEEFEVFERLSFDEMPYLTFDIIIEDPNKITTGAVIEVIYEPFDLVVYQQFVSYDDITYQDGAYHITDVFVTDLAPEEEYEIYLYISGNDGYYDYVNAIYRSWTVETKGYSGYREYGVHGLWLVIIDRYIDGDDLIVEYIYFNNGNVLNPYDNLPIELDANIYTDNLSDNQFVTGFSVPKDSSSIRIPLGYLDEHYSVFFETTQNQILVSKLNINFDKFAIDFYSYRNDMFGFNINVGEYDVVNVDLSFATTSSSTDYFLEIENLPLDQDYYEVPLDYDLSNYIMESIYVTMTVTYIGLNGEVTETYYNTSLLYD